MPPIGDPPELLNRNSMMRDTRIHGWFVQNSSDVPMRALRIGAVALAVGFLAMTGAARAQEEEDDKIGRASCRERVLMPV